MRIVPNLCCGTENDDYSVKHVGEQEMDVCKGCLRKTNSYDDGGWQGSAIIIMPFLRNVESVTCNRCGKDVTKYGWCFGCDGPKPTVVGVVA